MTIVTDYYTSRELFKAMGVRGNYMSGVIFSPRRKNPHPLAAAYRGRNEWDKKIVDKFLSVYFKQKRKRGGK
jgi:hypothetical protein